MSGIFRYRIFQFFLLVFSIFFRFLLIGSIPQCHAEITLDGTMGPSGNLPGPNYLIDESMGSRHGSNLFHSFGKFNVLTGESATFSGQNSIENVIGRVTAGEQSYINGLLRCSILDANLYLLNPEGFFFGPNAWLDINGSFHASSADYLRLSDGNIFYADPAKTSTLTTAPPSAFGFLDNNPGGISIQESMLDVPTGESLSMVGGDIEITGGPFGYLYAPGGRIYIVSAATAGEFVPDSNSATFADGGDIHISNSGYISTSGDPAGNVCIRGGNLSLNNSNIFSSTFGFSDGGLIDIGLTESMNLSNSAGIGASAWVGDGADILIGAQDVRIDGESRILTETQDIGDAGDIELSVRNLEIIDSGSMIGSATYWTGDAGDLGVTAANSILISGDHTTRLSTDTFGTAWIWPDGNAGDILVDSPVLIVDGGWISSYTGQWSSGDAGDILIDNVQRLEINNEGQITSSTSILGEGGNIIVKSTGSITISDFFSSIDTSSDGYDNAGSISLYTPILTLKDGGLIRAQTYHDGDAGNILVETDQLMLLDGGQINTDALTFLGGSGKGGKITVSAKEKMSISNQTDDPNVVTGITSTTFGIGDGGSISITNTPSLEIDDGRIQAITFGDGNAGDILLEVGRLDLANGSQIDASVSILGSGNGRGGNIQVTGSDSISIHGRSQRIPGLSSNITVSTFGSGDAGTVNILSPNLSIDDGLIQALTASTGNAGSINIHVGFLSLTGGGQVDSTTRAAGAGGNVVVRADDSINISGLDQAGEAVSGLFSSAYDSGDAGNVTVYTPVLKMDQGRIRAETRADGDGGAISLNLGSMDLTGGAQIDSTSRAAGKGGHINVLARDSISISGVDDDGYASGLLTDAYGEGAGGDIGIQAELVELSEGGLLSAKSSGTGNAGNISMSVGEKFLSRDSFVTTESKIADGGNIVLDAGYMIHLIESEITTSVEGGPQTTGGNITIDPDYVILKNSKIIANAYEGKGGNIRIVAENFIADPSSLVSASSALGIDGTVDISAPVINLSGLLSPLPKSFLSAAELLREPCEARLRGGEYSSFIISGRDGAPIYQPRGPLPSPIYFSGTKAEGDEKEEETIR